MDACWRQWRNQDGCDLVAIATASSSVSVTAIEYKNSLNSVSWHPEPNLTTQRGFHISITMKQTHHLPALIPKQMPLLSLSHQRREREEAEASCKTQNLIHTQIYGIKYANQTWCCKINNIKYSFTQTNTKSVPCPLQLLQVHFPLSMSSPPLSLLSLLSSFFFPSRWSCVFPRPTILHVRTAWMARKRREQGRGTLQLLSKETGRERERKRKRGGALLDETVNTAASSTAESGSYHMQRPGRDGGIQIKEAPPYPTKLIHKHMVMWPQWHCCRLKIGGVWWVIYFLASANSYYFIALRLNL